MIGVAGQYRFLVSIAGEEDFLIESDLQELKIVEEAGNVLPSFSIVFILQDRTILKYLNEGNPFEIAFGVDDLELTNIRFRIFGKPYISKLTQHQYLIKLVGLYDAIKYYSDCKVGVTAPMSGIEAIINAAGNHFEVDTNIQRSQDRQSWIQSNISDKSFVNQVWMHSYLPGSFPAIGISGEGDFIIRDIKKLSKEKYKWIFTSTDINKSNEIAIESWVLGSSTGFANAWMGYEREKPLWNPDTGIASISKPSLQPLLATTSSLDRLGEVGTRADDFGILNENVHANYHRAFQQNLGYLSLFSSGSVILLQFTGRYIGVKVLDLVFLRDLDIDLKGAEGYYSGSYLVSRVARIVESKKFVTLVQLTRESLSELQGEDLS